MKFSRFQEKSFFVFHSYKHTLFVHKKRIYLFSAHNNAIVSRYLT